MPHRPFRRRPFVRYVEIGALLDTFFVCAVSTILIIRLQLWATNYPKLGGGDLHIAHLLWGGLGMLIAIFVLLSFIGRARRQTAAIVGGVGFGFFIDEIGKFVTANNDYFFKPAAGMIYIVFVLLFLAIRAVARRRPLSPREALTNVCYLLTEAAQHDLQEEERKLARALLDRADPSDRLVAPLRALLEEIDCAPTPKPSRVRRMRDRGLRLYARLSAHPQFPRGVRIGFVLLGGLMLAQIGFGARAIADGTRPPHVIEIAGLASSLLVASLVWRGVLQMGDCLPDAYRTFEHALLVQIFFTEVFAFLEKQFGAVFGLLLNLALLFVVRSMIRAEDRFRLTGETRGAPAPTPVPPSPELVTG